MSLEALHHLMATGMDLELARRVGTAIGEEIAKPMEARNTIEKAKLAEMRAARQEHSFENLLREDAAFTDSAREEYLQAQAAADKLTAEALGEVQA